MDKSCSGFYDFMWWTKKEYFISACTMNDAQIKD